MGPAKKSSKRGVVELDGDATVLRGTPIQYGMITLLDKKYVKLSSG
jgi:hypothetical protein